MADVAAPITGSVFRIEVATGDSVAELDVLAIIESMKLEIPVETEVAGTVQQIHVAEGDTVGEGDVMFTVG
jgi:acetyl-CoA carboxylase biotin carboxyl carrier protein